MADEDQAKPSVEVGTLARRQWLRACVNIGMGMGALAWAEISKGEGGTYSAVPGQVTQPPPPELAGTQSVMHEQSWVTVFPAPGQEQRVLTIDSATDMALFAPVIRDFQSRHPDMTVRYADRPSLDIHDRALRHAKQGSQASQKEPYNPDLLISSSVDLQTQLVNDGLALAHTSSEAMSLPAGAHWRHEVFCLGGEAVVMAYNPKRLLPARAPQTRAQLLALLREPGSPLYRRVGMYDATVSGLGYMLATQDARFDSTAGVLLAAMGDAGVRFNDRIVPLIDQLASGQLALLYNVPASYVQARIVAGDDLRIIYPQDYTLLTTRAALIPATAGQAELARLFLDDLLSPQGQALLSRETRLLPIRQTVAAGQDARALSEIASKAGNGERTSGSSGQSHGDARLRDVQVPPGAWRPITPGLGLLVYLDPLKRQRFLNAWRAAVIR